MEKRKQYEYNIDAFFSGHTHNAHYAKFGCTEFINAGDVGYPLDGGQRGCNVVKVTPEGFCCDFR